MASLISSQMSNGVRCDWTDWSAYFGKREGVAGRAGQQNGLLPATTPSSVPQHTRGQSSLFVCNKAQFRVCPPAAAADHEKQHQDPHSFCAPLQEGDK